MSFNLDATQRIITGKKLNALRADSLVPGILYGFGIKENQLVQVPAVAFEKIYENAGENQVVDLHVEEKEVYPVLIKDIQIDPVKRAITHVDFLAIDTTQPVEVELPIHFTGEAPAVKTAGGNLVKTLDTVLVRCLPKDLLPYVEVPLASLEAIGDVISIGDIQLPDTIEVLRSSDDAIATVTAPRVETEPTPASEADGVGGTEGESGSAKASNAKEESSDDKGEKKEESK